MTIVMHDTIDRGQVADALRFRTHLLNAVQQAVIATDLEGTITYWNRFAEALYGWSAAEVIGRRIDAVIAERPSGEGAAEIMACLRAGETWSGEFAVQRRDGTCFLARVTDAPILDEGGALIGIVGVTEDITQRKQSEHAMREYVRQAALSADVGVALAQGDPLPAALQRCAEALLRHLDVGLVRIWVLNPDQNILELQATGGLIHRGGDRSDRVAPEGRPTDRSSPERPSPPVISGGQRGWGAAQRRGPTPVPSDVCPNDPQVTDPDQARREGWVAFTDYPLLVADRMVGVLSLLAEQPLTKAVFQALASVADTIAVGIERKRAEERLRVSEERYRLTARATNDLIWDWDIVAGKVVFSEALQPLFGYAIEETGTAIGDVFEWWEARIHPDDWKDVVTSLHRFLDGSGDVWSYDYRFRRKDGSYATVVDRCYTARDEDGKPLRLVGTMMDLTERKRAEEKLTLTARRMALLVAMAKTVGSTLDLDLLLDRLLSHLVLAIPAADLGSVCIYDAEANVLIPAACRGYDPEAYCQVRLRPGESVSGKVYVTGRPILAADAGEIVALTADLQPENVRLLNLAMGSTPLAGIISAPLQARTGEVIGTLSLGSVRTGFTLEDLSLLEALAAQAALAVQNARLFAEVRAGGDRLEKLSRRLVELQETERRRLARELHDEIGQSLTRLKLTLEMSTGLPSDQLPEGLREAPALVADLIARVRALSLDLRPAMLDDLGLLPALLWHLERYGKQTGIRVAFEHVGLQERFPTEMETVIYRIVQEALTNVARHAGVEDVTVRVWATAATLGVQIEDRGVGFDPQVVTASGVSNGMTGMQERVALAGGQLVVEAAPGEGTRLTAEFPLGKPQGSE